MMKSRHQPQLKAFRWQGTNKVGTKLTGRYLAYTDVEVRHGLQQQHIVVSNITPRSLSVVERLSQRVKSKDITMVTRQMAIMLATGMPIIAVLKLVAVHHHKGEMKSILWQISALVESGLPLSEALRRSSHHFDALYSDLVSAGEQTGKLADIFQRIAHYREKSQQLKANIIKALIYPSMVIVTAWVVCYLMLTLVVPQFESIFASFGAQLPWLTIQVLKLSSWSQTYLGLIIAVFSAISLLFNIVSKKSRRLALLHSRLILQLPIVGNVLSKAAIARFSRTLATGFSAGLPVLSCLETAARTAGNSYYQHALKQVYSNTASGMPLNIAMRSSSVFPEMVLQMVMVGEESGQLDEVLNKIADIYENSVESSVDTLGKTLEPLIIIFLGITVGGLVVAMYLPIFNLMNVLG